MNINK